MKSINNQRGAALFVVLFVCLVLLILGSSLIWVMVNESKLMENYVDSTTALFLAEAGIEQGLWELRTDVDSQASAGYGWYDKIIESDGFSETIKTFDEFKVHIESQVLEGTLKDVKLTVELPQPIASPTGEMEAPTRYGFVTITSTGSYRGVDKTVTVKKPITAGIFGPGFDFSFFVKDEAHLTYNELSDFVVHGDKLYMSHANIELSDRLVDKFDKKGELQFMDSGYGFGLDALQNPIQNLLGKETFSGNDFTDIKELDGQIYRQYYDYKGLELGSFHGIPYPKWPWQEVEKDEEEYSSKVVPKQMNDIPDMYEQEDYEAAARSCGNYFDKPSDFENVNYEMFSLLGNDFRETNYNNVKEYNGWGDWKNKKPAWYQFWKNPTKADDSSQPIELNGFEFVDGDVHIEGYYKGKGVIVATGNIYIGGDLVKWVPTDENSSEKDIEEAQKKSSIQLVALGGKNGDKGVVYKPHHDKDWARYPKLNRDLDPVIQAYIYSKNGISLDTDSLMQKLVNLNIEGNLICDKIDWKDRIHDVTIQPDKYDEEMRKNLQNVYGAHLRNYFIVIMRNVVKWEARGGRS